MNEKLKRQILRPAVVTFAIVLAIISYALFFSGERESLKVALPMNGPEDPIETPEQGVWPGSAGWPASAYLAMKYGQAHGMVTGMRPEYRLAGKGAVAAMRDGLVDVAWTFGPPVVDNVLNGTDLVILAVVMRSYGQARIFTHPENVEDWFTKRVALKTGTILDSMLAAQLREIGELDRLRNGELTIVPVEAPDNAFYSLIEGYVETASFPGAHADLVAMQSLRDGETNFVDISIRDAYRMSGFLVTQRDTFRRREEALFRLLKIFKGYGEYVAQNPEEELSKMLLLEQAGAEIFDPFEKSWGADDFLIVTDKESVRQIIEFEARVRLDAGFIPDMPDFEPALSELDNISRYLSEH